MINNFNHENCNHSDINVARSWTLWMPSVFTVYPGQRHAPFPAWTIASCILAYLFSCPTCFCKQFWIVDNNNLNFFILQLNYHPTQISSTYAAIFVLRICQKFRQQEKPDSDGHRNVADAEKMLHLRTTGRDQWDNRNVVEDYSAGPAI